MVATIWFGYTEEEGRLMIMHGSMDENVHFMQHTAQLINLLIKHGKPYHLQVGLSQTLALSLPVKNIGQKNGPL